MGMDLYGKKPGTETGKYFRNNVWWWHPLWNYCLGVAPEICGKVENGHSNDGDGLGKRDSLALAQILRAKIASGETHGYAETYAVTLEALPSEQCFCCAGTGKRLPPPLTGAGNQPCNACDGSGETRPSATMYPFSVENVTEFANFLEHCGGFEIC